MTTGELALLIVGTYAWVGVLVALVVRGNWRVAVAWWAPWVNGRVFRWAQKGLR